MLEGQLRGIAQVLRKRRRALAELQWKLKRSQEPGAKGKGYTLKSLQAHAQHLSAGQYIQKILRVEIRRQGGKLQLNYHTDGHALEKLTATCLEEKFCSLTTTSGLPRKLSWLTAVSIMWRPPSAP